MESDAFTRRILYEEDDFNLQLVRNERYATWRNKLYDVTVFERIPRGFLRRRMISPGYEIFTLMKKISTPPTRMKLAFIKLVVGDSGGFMKERLGRNNFHPDGELRHGK